MVGLQQALHCSRTFMILVAMRWGRIGWMGPTKSFVSFCRAAWMANGRAFIPGNTGVNMSTSKEVERCRKHDHVWSPWTIAKQIKTVAGVRGKVSGKGHPADSARLFGEILRIRLRSLFLHGTLARHVSTHVSKLVQMTCFLRSYHLLMALAHITYVTWCVTWCVKWYVSIRTSQCTSQHQSTEDLDCFRTTPFFMQETGTLVFLPNFKAQANAPCFAKGCTGNSAAQRAQRDTMKALRNLTPLLSVHFGWTSSMLRQVPHCSHCRVHSGTVPLQYHYSITAVPVLNVYRWCLYWRCELWYHVQGDYELMTEMVATLFIASEMVRSRLERKWRTWPVEIESWHVMQSAIVKQSSRDEPACSQQLRGASLPIPCLESRCRGLFWRAWQAQVFHYPRTAIRGSRYRGDSWDNFLHHIPSSSHGIGRFGKLGSLLQAATPWLANFSTEVVVPYEWQCHLFSASSLATFSCTEAGGARRGGAKIERLSSCYQDNSCQKQLGSLHFNVKQSVNTEAAFVEVLTRDRFAANRSIHQEEDLQHCYEVDFGPSAHWGSLGCNSFGSFCCVPTLRFSTT